MRSVTDSVKKQEIVLIFLELNALTENEPSSHTHTHLQRLEAVFHFVNECPRIYF